MSSHRYGDGRDHGSARYTRYRSAGGSMWDHVKLIGTFLVVAGLVFLVLVLTGLAG